MHCAENEGVVCVCWWCTHTNVKDTKSFPAIFFCFLPLSYCNFCASHSKGWERKSKSVMLKLQHFELLFYCWKIVFSRFSPSFFAPLLCTGSGSGWKRCKDVYCLRFYLDLFQRMLSIIFTFCASFLVLLCSAGFLRISLFIALLSPKTWLFGWFLSNWVGFVLWFTELKVAHRKFYQQHAMNCMSIVDFA